MPIRPLDPSTDRRHVLDPVRDGDRETLSWSVVMPELQVALEVQTWVDAYGRAGTLALAYGPRVAGWSAVAQGSRASRTSLQRIEDLRVGRDDTFANWNAGPLHVALREPQGTSQVRYLGGRIVVDCVFEPSHPPYSYAQHPEPWSVHDADDRLEQGGRASGEARIDGDEVLFDGLAHRSHAWGVRTPGAATHRTRVHVLAGDLTIHATEVRGPRGTAVRGYVDRDGLMAEVVAATFDVERDGDGFHRRFAVAVTDDAGRTTRARLGRPELETTYAVGPAARVFGIVGICEVDGRAATGSIEVTRPTDPAVAGAPSA